MQVKNTQKVPVPIILIIVVLGALAVGYFMGARKAPPLTGSTSGISTETPSHQDDIPTHATRIPGAEHVHALTFDAKGNLLLGAHGGLFKSSDGGKTWAKVETKGSVNSDDFMSLVPDPRDRNTLFAAGHDLGVVKSTDGGITWMRADEGIRGTDVHGLAINQRNPDSLFAYSVGNGAFKSTDGGASWKRMDDGPENPGVRSFGYAAVQTSMDRSMGWDNWGLLLAGTSDGLFQSFSCFCGWTKTTEEFTNMTVYTLATLHADPNVLYAGTTNGAWKSIDVGKTWVPLPGIEGAKITALAINPENAGELVASSEEGVISKSTDVGGSWQQVN